MALEGSDQWCRPVCSGIRKENAHSICVVFYLIWRTCWCVDVGRSVRIRRCPISQLSCAPTLCRSINWIKLPSCSGTFFCTLKTLHTHFIPMQVISFIFADEPSSLDCVGVCRLWLTDIFLTPLLALLNCRGGKSYSFIIRIGTWSTVTSHPIPSAHLSRDLLSQNNWTPVCFEFDACQKTQQPAMTPVMCCSWRCQLPRGVTSFFFTCQLGVSQVEVQVTVIPRQLPISKPAVFKSLNWE